MDETDELREPTYAALQPADGDGPPTLYAGSVPLERTGTFGYTVRVLPSHSLLAYPAELGLVSLPGPGTVYTDL